MRKSCRAVFHKRSSNISGKDSVDQQHLFKTNFFICTCCFCLSRAPPMREPQRSSVSSYFKSAFRTPNKVKSTYLESTEMLSAFKAFFGPLDNKENDSALTSKLWEVKRVFTYCSVFSLQLISVQMVCRFFCA